MKKLIINTIFYVILIMGLSIMYKTENRSKQMQSKIEFVYQNF